MPVDIYRGTNSMALPSDISAEIIQKTTEESAIMRLARRIALPGRGITIPVITGDPTAAWVAETGVKPHSNGTPATKLMSAYKIAVIETFSKEFVRDVPALYDALVSRLPAALAAVFDNTVIGGQDAPGANFDRFNSVQAQDLSGQAGAYAALVAADSDIAAHGGVLNGFALAPAARGILLSAVDSTGRPLFINSVADGAIPRILGAATYFNKNLYVSGSPNVVGIAGDWSQAMYGTVNGVEITFSDTATISGIGPDTNPYSINLWQQNMVAVRAEMEVGFRADTSVFNKLTASPSGSTGATGATGATGET